MADEDLYAVLGLVGGGPQLLQQELRKAYRMQALVWHPDKQAGKKPADVAAAAVEFDKIQRACGILWDEKARKAYDELRKLRKVRLKEEKQFKTKRRKMLQDLRNRERAFETERADKREEDRVAKRLKAEISRIREQAKKWTKVGVRDSSSASTGRSANSQNGVGSATPAQAAEMSRTLKISWACTDGGASGYTANRLQEIFAEFGAVEDVVISENKSPRKGSAVVVMSSKAAAAAATERACGDLSNPLLVVPLLPSSTARTEPVVNPGAAADAVDGFVHVVGSSHRSYENDILTKMRQSAERARIIKEMQEADAKAT